MQPVLRAAFAEYHQVFGGRLMWGRLCRAAGIQNQQDLPFIHGMYDEKQNKHLVCFAHICGFCWPAEQNNCRFIPGHLSADRIPDGYARALRDKLAPGIKWMLDNRDQVLRDAAAEKQARKRQKRNPKGGGALTAEHWRRQAMQIGGSAS